MPEIPPFSPTVTLLTIGRIWESALAAALKPLGLTIRKYSLLGHIRGTPGISFSELARRSRITVQSVHVAIAAFVEDGWVEDTTARAGAASQLRVTEAGDRLLAEVAHKVAELDAEFAAAHPGITEALRLHVAELMAEAR
jgi:DNA-binding MarR family transcriptional regulator